MCLLTYTKCIGVDLVLKVFLAEKSEEEGGVFQVAEMYFYINESNKPALAEICYSFSPQSRSLLPYC